MTKSSYSVDLIKQMAECDANYIRLLKLVPGLDEPEKLTIGTSTEFCIADLYPGDKKVTVEIHVIESFRYTTTLEITQKPVFRKWMTNPSMLVRVYHDANTAEVYSYQGHRNLKPRYERPNPNMYQPDEKMQVNHFLGEWLTHCLKVGRSIKAPGIIF